MKKIQKHIEIVRSITPGLSSIGRRSCNAIYAVLQRHYTTVGITMVSSEADLEQLVAKRPDLVFMGMKLLRVPQSGLEDQIIWISEYLDQHNIEHTGSSKVAIEFERNKALAKQEVLAAGLRTAPFFVMSHGSHHLNMDEHLQFPLFVKPTCLGGGAGIDDSSVTHDIVSLHNQVRVVSEMYSSDVLIEQYLPGREFSVALLRSDSSSELMAMPIELVAQSNVRGERILGQKMKALDVEEVLPVTDELVRAQVIELARGVFQALGARDYGRIDIRLDSLGVPHFLEANLIPSLISGYGSFPKACVLNIGMDYEAMILHIVNLGLSRFVAETTQELPLLSALLSPTAV